MRSVFPTPCQSTTRTPCSSSNNDPRGADTGGVPMMPPKGSPLSRHHRPPGQQRRLPRPRPLSASARSPYLALAVLAIAARLLSVQGYVGGDVGGGGVDDGLRSKWRHPGSRPRRSDPACSRHRPWSGVGGANERKEDGGGDGRGAEEERRRRRSAYQRDDRRPGGKGRSRDQAGRRGAGMGRRSGGDGDVVGGGGWAERRRTESMREIIKLAKSDAEAVRAAAVEAGGGTVAAAEAEAEAAWAAAGAVGSGGGRGDNAMLFLECEVNGRSVRAFVDTGAQVTVISAACAERCGLSTRIDRRFAGRAVGVGFARILGRIHDAGVRIGNSYYLRCSFTVIEHGEIDLLVGLDVLRAHRCDISLSRNRIKFFQPTAAGERGLAKEVAFLSRVESENDREHRRPRRRGGVGRRWSRRSSVSQDAGNTLPDVKHGPSPSPYPRDGCVDGHPCSSQRPATKKRSYGGGEGPEGVMRHRPPPFPFTSPSPRVLRELARGTRGDGTPASSLPLSGPSPRREKRTRPTNAGAQRFLAPDDDGDGG